MTRMPDPNAPPCDCGWLEDAANDPCVPIVFDHDLNEYHIVRSGELGGRAIIYHCPFCGGRAPKSARGSKFHTVTTEETMRLQQLTRDAKTVRDVIKALGPPDMDLDAGQGITTAMQRDEPPRTEYFRVLRYNGLSDTAIVDAIVYPDDRVHFSYMAKHKER